MYILAVLDYCTRKENFRISCRVFTGAELEQI